MHILLKEDSTPTNMETAISIPKTVTEASDLAATIM